MRARVAMLVLSISGLFLANQPAAAVLRVDESVSLHAHSAGQNLSPMESGPQQLDWAILGAGNLNPDIVRTPAAPSALTVTGLSPTSARLDWNTDSISQDTYLIERAPAAGAFVEVALIVGSAATYTDNLLPGSGDYRYRVTARSGQVETASAEVTLPAAPGNFRPVYPFPAIPLVINLVWDDNSALETGYTLEISSDGGGSWAPLVTSAQDAQGFTFNPGICGLDARFRLRAVAGGGQSTALAASAVTLPCPPVLTAVALGTAVVLSWPDVGGETGYIVEEWDGNQFMAAIFGNLPSGTTQFTLRNLLPHLSIRMRLKAVNAAGYVLSNEVTAVTTQPFIFFIPLVNK